MHEKIWLCVLGVIGVIPVVVGTSMQLGRNIEHDNVLKACTSAGEIEMMSGVLKIRIKCNVDGVGV